MNICRSFSPLVCFALLVASANPASSADSSPATVEQSNPHDGTWRSDAVFYAVVTIHGDGGSWRRYAFESDRRNNPCSTLNKRIRVDRATPKELDFTVLNSEALAGCKDFSFSLKLSESETLVGPASNTGRIFEFTRR